MNKKENAEKILQLIQEEAIVQFPLFPEAFDLLQLQPYPLQKAALGTDGTFLFYDADAVCELFQTNAALLRWTYLHTMLHILLGHEQARMRDTAAFVHFSDELKKQCTADELADLEVSCLAFLLTKDTAPPLQQFFAAPEAIQNLMEHIRIIPFRESLRYTLLNNSETDTLSEANNAAFQTIFFCDSHEKWPTALPGDQMETARVTASDSKTSTRQTPFLSKERLKQKVFAKAGEQAGSGSGKHGFGTGGVEEDALLQPRESLDYSAFLRRFTIAREEAVLDTDSFDYIPYHYGLTHYGNLPFIEPLEYKEVNRLDELAIAIDTSGSCSGIIVRRFLEETWNILRQKENFFSKMRLHLIQCDCMVQEHRIFTSAAEFEEALPALKIHGHGDTDFQPVFTHLEKLIAKGEIRQLRALLFFTDGDGIYPPTPPPFDTAFVFLNDALQKQQIPDWGIRLNLNLPECLLET